MERYGGGSIVVSDYDPAWPAMFEHERTSLHAALDPFVLTIEHIGSTAVPGLAAKPIIDLQASVRRLAEAQSRCVEPLQALGSAGLLQVRRQGGGFRHEWDEARAFQLRDRAAPPLPGG